MMLPDRNPPTDPPRPETPPSTEPPKVKAKAKDAADPNAKHTDYNLLPLPVKGLDHYVNRDEDERFRVS